ncbi:MAG: PfkB family carbohydrate kinase [bacterium]
MRRTKALVVGSVAYDVVFEVHNTFSKEVIVKQNQIQNMSMMLTAKNKKIFYGGTAGNIAYGLGLLKVKPLLFSVVGGDFKADYQAHLSSHNVDLKVVIMPDEFTATFYAISDQKREQIGIFQPNSHGDHMDNIQLQDKLTASDFAAIKVAIFSPGTGQSIFHHLSQLRQNAGQEPIVIFDPSQILSIFFTKESLITCLRMSNILIGNETEIAQFKTLFKLSTKDILDLGLEYVIETLGKNGSIIYTKKDTKKINPLPVKNFVEQTGAGDAFRAGFIKGLLDDKSIEACCNLGSIMGAQNVQSEGGQKYRLDN